MRELHLVGTTHTLLTNVHFIMCAHNVQSLLHCMHLANLLASSFLRRAPNPIMPYGRPACSVFAYLEYNDVVGWHT